jgi:FKBP-type peptidyl-prolyl cis-trans isomerase 2
MRTAKIGDTVKVHCMGRLEDGQEICNTKTDQPLLLTIGNGDLLPGLEAGIVGMQIGDTKAVAVMPEQAYGRRIEALVVEVKKKDLADDILPQIGHQIEYTQPDGEQVNMTITEIDPDTVAIDANHPLAGHQLFFDVELLEIEESGGKS